MRKLAFPGGGASEPHRLKYIVVGASYISCPFLPYPHLGSYYKDWL